MIVDLFQKMDLLSRLEIEIRKEYEPQTASEEDIAANIWDAYDYDLDAAGTTYFSIQDNELEDVLSYTKFCGGFSVFDFVL